MQPLVVAIDGPAGAGKSTVARGLAARLGLRFLDTGAMYRAVTLLGHEAGLSASDGQGLARLARETALDFDAAGRVVVGERELEPAIRSERVTADVSEVSAHPAVRAAVVSRQQEFGELWEGLVAEGRDTTTVVFPRARFRFYLDASPTERARRRALELGLPGEVDRIRADIELRDAKDSSRAHSPLTKGEGVVVVETDGLDAVQVIGLLLEHLLQEGVQPGGQGVSEPGPEVLTTKTFTYHLLVSTAWVGSKTFFPTRVEGREQVPAEGPVVLCSNHQSFLDIPLIAASLRRHVCFVARESLARSPLMARIMEGCGAVLVRRGESDHGALKEMVAHLEAGDCVCIFPEGTRTRDGSLGTFQRGALLAARRGQAPVVPVGIQGSFEAWLPGRRLPRPHRVSIRYGEAVDPKAPGAVEIVRQRVADAMQGR